MALYQTFLCVVLQHKPVADLVCSKIYDHLLSGSLSRKITKQNGQREDPIFGMCFLLEEVRYMDRPETLFLK